MFAIFASKKALTVELDWELNVFFMKFTFSVTVIGTIEKL